MGILIVETVSYTIQDVLDRVKDDFGFDYNDEGDGKGYFLVGGGNRLLVEFDEDTQSLNKAEISLPSRVIDVTDSSASADMYSSSVEAAIQITELIKMLLRGDDDA